MARPSKRAQLLDAAIAVAARDGVRGVSFNSVVDECGISKGGLLYHFPTRDALVDAVVTHIADRWRTRLVAALAVPFDRATLAQRCAAYITVSFSTADPGDLALLQDGLRDPAAQATWRCLMDDWLLPRDGERPLTMDQRAALLAADGVWLASTSGMPMPGGEPDRDALADELVRRVSVEGVASADATPS